MNRFDSLLVANRGEIARRVFRTATARGLRTVAVFVAADAEAPFVVEADIAVRIDSYLDGDAIIEAARQTGAAALHPGYGFLAESACFAESVEAAGIIWVGPGPAAISAMGDKVEAKKLAVDAGVPVLPSSDDVDKFASLGFPLLVKAAAGGGGKGMRIVESLADLPEAVSAAKREALSGFGDDRVFAERYVPVARHIEIQVLGDSHGNLVHLGERECSIQRRHQKVIEESPSPAIDETTRINMGEAAIRLCEAMCYRSAGTVEFLVDDKTKEYFFLEVNTRLQVEHPVTEAVTGRDLVGEQLRVAAGEELGYNQSAITFTGHSIEARLYAEDATNNFLPATGTLEAFHPAETPKVRWDAGIQAGSVIGVDFDPMIAKVIAHGSTRADAAGQLALALERLHIGGVVNNRDFLTSVLRSEEFLAGDTTTDFIERVRPSVTRGLTKPQVDYLATAAAMWLQAANRRSASVLSSLPSGFVVGRIPPERVELGLDGHRHEVHYRLGRDGRFAVGPSGEPKRTVLVHSSSADRIDVEIDRNRQTLRVARGPDSLHISGAGGAASFDLMPRFAVPDLDMPGGAVTAPMPGKVLEVRVDPGDQVESGQVVVVLEAMKMENHLRATEAGSVTEVKVAVGEQVEKDVLLLVIDSGMDAAHAAAD